MFQAVIGDLWRSLTSFLKTFYKTPFWIVLNGNEALLARLERAFYKGELAASIEFPLLPPMMSHASPKYEHRPTFAEIDLAALERNYRSLEKLAGSAKLMPVIKANAYGHGLVECGRRLEKLGAPYLGVAYLEEAAALRAAGVQSRILVFGGLLSEQVERYLDLGIDITAPSVSKIETINEVARSTGKRAKVHLKIDTGLERLGVHYYSSQQLFDAALKAESCDVAGVFSHFAAVSMTDLSFTRLQLERFNECLRYFQERAKEPFLRHIAASAGLLAVPESHLDMVRPGLILYGVYPNADFKHSVSLDPVLSLKSQVVYFKVVKKGAGVSYGLRWTAPCDTRVVTIPLGYGDGYSRRLTNRGKVLIRGAMHDMVGSVCMDQLMVNVGPEGTAYNGDEVVVIGRQGEKSISAEDVAEWCDTIPWEVLVTLNERIPRVYLGT